MSLLGLDQYGLALLVSGIYVKQFNSLNFYFTVVINISPYVLIKQ